MVAVPCRVWTITRHQLRSHWRQPQAGRQEVGGSLVTSSCPRHLCMCMIPQPPASNYRDEYESAGARKSPSMRCEVESMHDAPVCWEQPGGRQCVRSVRGCCRPNGSKVGSVVALQLLRLGDIASTNEWGDKSDNALCHHAHAGACSMHAYLTAATRPPKCRQVFVTPRHRGSVWQMALQHRQWKANWPPGAPVCAERHVHLVSEE